VLALTARKRKTYLPATTHALMGIRCDTVDDGMAANRSPTSVAELLTTMTKTGTVI
jgi:hypothetical protein